MTTGLEKIINKLFLGPMSRGMIAETSEGRKTGSGSRGRWEEGAGMSGWGGSSVSEKLPSHFCVVFSFRNMVS